MPARPPKSEEHIGLTIRFSLWSLWLTAEIGLLFDLFHVERIKEVIGVGLGSFGAIFAIQAMVDAHKAFLKAEQVEEALGSFRMSFQEVFEEMVNMCRNARSELSILIPTPGYGYLFDEADLSRMFVEELEKFLGRDGTRLNLFLILGDRSRPPRESIPQRYLRRAFQLEEGMSRAVTPNGYIELVEKVFTAINKNPTKANLTLLGADPNVRLVIADADNQDRRCCLLSFAQSEPDNVEREFKSTGFKSTHGHMVQAVQDLLAVYSSELGSKVDPSENDFIKSFYVIAR